MGDRQTSNFEKRFKRGFQVIPQKLPEGAARSVQQQKICAAVKDVLAGILKREPTPNEISGCEPIMRRKRA